MSKDRRRRKPLIAPSHGSSRSSTMRLDRPRRPLSLRRVESLPRVESVLTELAEVPKGGVQAPSPSTPGYTPDLVRDSQYYVLEITDYGAKLAAILISIHEADPDDESVGSWHRVTAGQMIIDRVLGSAVDLAQTTDRPIDPTEEPDWMLKHPADIDSEATPEELMKAGRATRELIQDYRQQIASCEDCTDEDLCDEHYMDEDAMLMSARVFRTMQVVGNRIYFDFDGGGIKLHPRGYIDDEPHRGYAPYMW